MDFLIVCDEPEYRDTENEVLLNPIALIEVLSPTTEKYDRTIKFERYTQIETLRDDVLVAQHAPHLEHHVFNAARDWRSQTLTGLDAVLTLSGVSVTLKLADIYARIKFDS